MRFDPDAGYSITSNPLPNTLLKPIPVTISGYGLVL